MHFEFPPKVDILSPSRISNSGTRAPNLSATTAISRTYSLLIEFNSLAATPDTSHSLLT